MLAGDFSLIPDRYLLVQEKMSENTNSVPRKRPGKWVFRGIRVTLFLGKILVKLGA